MTTAIAVYNSEGCVGRCDAKCHDATSLECDCVCRGRLHGIGRDNAISENTRHFLGDEAAAAAEAWARDHGIELKGVRVRQAPALPEPELELWDPVEAWERAIMEPPLRRTETVKVAGGIL